MKNTFEMFNATALTELRQSGVKRRGYLRKASVVFVILMAVAMGVVSLPQFVMIAEADGGDKTITGLGTGAIRNPLAPEDEDTEWRGSYVYFGKYDANGDGTAEPVRYRVLDKASGDFGVSGRSLLLDCDTMLYDAQFDPQKYQNIWAKSDVRKRLNEGGNSFLGQPGNFTDAEKSAIAESRKSDPAPGDGDDISDCFSFAPLSGEKVFVLDAVEVVRASYGYTDSSGESESRRKSDQGGWWLRSPYDVDYEELHYRFAGYVDNYGYYYDKYIIDEGSVSAHEVTKTIGVSPALNVRLSSVMFSSLIPSSPSGAGETGAEYKLTLMKSGLSADVGAVTREGDAVTILFAVDPLAGPTQVSVVVTKDQWASWEGLNHDAGLLQYAKLNGQWDENGIGTGTFTLDTSKVTGTWGKDYHVYIFAEEVKGEKETDYAGAPHEVESPISVAVEGYGLCGNL